MNGSSMSFPSGIFSELERLGRELDAAFGNTTATQGIRATGAGAFPAINIGNTPGSTEVFAFLPGVDPNKVELVLHKGVLTLSGERVDEVPTESEQVNVYRRQRFHGRFKRAISVPEDVDPDQVKASYRDGVLNISLKRSGAAQPRRIAIA
ncbi:Hsp20/alpha crystallin family protein [Chitinimonas sp.]|uniref:Hsp20/alpha crystallin family protein n=1 Tax=Chitinimonas sp. TaxID=1934313 RepID=UPI002F942A20